MAGEEPSLTVWGWVAVVVGSIAAITVGIVGSTLLVYWLLGAFNT